MKDLRGFDGPRAGRGAIIGLGGGYLLFAFGQSALRFAQGASIWEIWIDFVLVASVGLALLYGGHYLKRAQINPERYGSIGRWCLGGFGALLALIVVFQVNPGTEVTSPGRAVPLLTSLGSLGGFAIGIHRARAAELRQTQARLEEVINKLENSNDRLDQFATAVSHDLKEPLRSMTVQLELLERTAGDALDESDHEELNEAIESAKRLRRMIDGLLEYARVHSGERRVEEVDCEEVLGDVMSDLSALIEEREANVIVGDLPVVYGNRDQLHQVFQNLLENAIKYTEGAPAVRIDADRVGSDWRLSIEDNGIGIGSEDLDRIFDLFERSHHVEETEGIGLGLALCREIVEGYGGEISVDSAPGQGSTFYLTLPTQKPHTMPLRESVGSLIESEWD